MVPKVEEPKDYSECWECPRCNQDYCNNCVDWHKVEFDIADGSDKNPKDNIEWKGLLVCPWCYNQLIDLKEKQTVETHIIPSGTKKSLCGKKNVQGTSLGMTCKCLLWWARHVIETDPEYQIKLGDAK